MDLKKEIIIRELIKLVIFGVFIGLFLLTIFLIIKYTPIFVKYREWSAYYRTSEQILFVLLAIVLGTAFVGMFKGTEREIKIKDLIYYYFGYYCYFLMFLLVLNICFLVLWKIWPFFNLD